MTTDREQLALRNRLQDVLGAEETTTLWSMLRTHDDLATKADLASLGERLQTAIASMHTELKTEMTAMCTELKQEDAAVRADLHSFIRTFITVQAATVVGATGIVYALFRLT